MTTAFETLRAFAARLGRDHLDEDDSEVEVTSASGKSTQRYQQRTVTLRGQLDGVAIVVMHQRYYFRTPTPPVAPDVLEVFTTDRGVHYEGTVRPREGWRWLQQLFGGGGLVGSHRLYDAFTLDFQIPRDARLLAAGFEDRLLHYIETERPLDLTLQADVGVTGVYRFHGPPDAVDAVDAVEARVRRQMALWPTLMGA